MLDGNDELEQCFLRRVHWRQGARGHFQRFQVVFSSQVWLKQTQQ